MDWEDVIEPNTEEVNMVVDEVSNIILVTLTQQLNLIFKFKRLIN